jgi:GNAT superfamily N-acetyltransferase
MVRSAMTTVRVEEVPPGSTWRTVDALLALRPGFAPPERLVSVIDERLRPAGYRLVAVFVGEGEQAVAAAGFRESFALAWDRCLYVDDLSTVPAERGQGYADRLMRWLLDEAHRLGCASMHLDSGVGPDRAAAHRLYMRHRLRVSAHHFHRELGLG